MTCGVGQCIKEVAVGKWFEIDFCSKWAMGRSDVDFVMIRDVKKLFTTRQYYSKSN